MITTSYDFNDPREREVIQIITKGSVDMIPPLPTMVDLALYRPNKKAIRVSRRIHSGYRSAVTGDGVCSKCLQQKKSKEFATPSGFICHTCKANRKKLAKMQKMIDVCG